MIRFLDIVFSVPVMLLGFLSVCEWFLGHIFLCVSVCFLGIFFGTSAVFCVLYIFTSVVFWAFFLGRLFFCMCGSFLGHLFLCTSAILWAFSLCVYCIGTCNINMEYPWRPCSTLTVGKTVEYIGGIYSLYLRQNRNFQVDRC